MRSAGQAGHDLAAPAYFGGNGPRLAAARRTSGCDVTNWISYPFVRRPIRAALPPSGTRPAPSGPRGRASARPRSGTFQDILARNAGTDPILAIVKTSRPRLMQCETAGKVPTSRRDSVDKSSPKPSHGRPLRSGRGGALCAGARGRAARNVGGASRGRSRCRWGCARWYECGRASVRRLSKRSPADGRIR
jgi:hypothetical protein